MSFGFGFGMAKAAAFLSGPVPSLNLQFAGNTVLDPRITFTRASSATYFNSSGVLTSAGNNVARFDYNPTTLAPLGLLIEEQRTNLLTYSEDFSNVGAWALGEATLSTNATVAPDGNITADKLIENTANAGHIVSGGIPTSGQAQTFSVFAKAAERTRINLAGGGFTAQGLAAQFDLSNGTIVVNNGNTARIQSVGNGWYRCSISFTPSNTNALQIQLADGSGSTTYTGNGVSGVFIWGAQLEAGSFATSYIPTVAAQVTRSADSASMTGSNFSSWYNATEGTLYAEGSIPFVGGPNFPGLFTVDDGTVNNSATLYVSDGGADYPSFAGYSGGVNQWDIARPVAYTPNTVLKMAGAYKANDFSAAFSGVLGTPDTSGTVPTVTTARIGAVRGGNSPLNGWIRKVAFYPTRLANATLQALTT